MTAPELTAEELAIVAHFDIHDQELDALVALGRALDNFVDALSAIFMPAMNWVLGFLAGLKPLDPVAIVHLLGPDSRCTNMLCGTHPLRCTLPAGHDSDTAVPSLHRVDPGEDTRCVAALDSRRGTRCILTAGHEEKARPSRHIFPHERLTETKDANR